MSQKIIIPKGLINPDETTIIEIPEEVQNVETVVAKPIYINHQTMGEASSEDICDTDEVFEYLYHGGCKIDLPLEPKIKYAEEEFYADSYHRKPRSKKHHIKTTSSYPTYEYYDKNMHKDISYYSYSNSLAKPASSLANIEQEFKDNDMFSLLPTPKNCNILKTLTAKDVISVLDILEKVEFNRLSKNLKDYQGARRRLLYETANIHTFDDVTMSLSGLY